MNTFPKTLIIVPAYNESESISHVIDSISINVPWADIAVVNDGSTDSTPEIVRSKNVTLLNLPCNLGIGAAVQTGYKFAYQEGYEIAVQVDGDGQHPSFEIEKLVSSVIHKKANMVVGSRYINGNKQNYKNQLFRRVGIKILSLVVSILARQKLFDTTSGFRAVDRKTICFLSRMYPYDYPEPEVLVMLHREGFKIVEVPVSMNQRMGGESSINLINGVYYMNKVILASMIDILKKRIYQA